MVYGDERVAVVQRDQVAAAEHVSESSTVSGLHDPLSSCPTRRASFTMLRQPFGDANPQRWGQRLSAVSWIEQVATVVPEPGRTKLIS